jgi:plastocyanin
MRKLIVLAALPVAAGLIAFGAIGAGAQGGHGAVHQVRVPDSDRFIPFGLTIHAGDTVQWVNHDADAHTVVSDPPFDTAGHKHVDKVISATGGKFALRFDHPGSFVYFCRFHAHLDHFNQPIAPGPRGGIQNAHGNFGTPMSGVVTVLP